MEPANPIDAATHPNPYPYYARLRSGPALYYDQELRLWVVASATAISQVFDSPSCRVRPMSEPVPSALDGLAAGEIFSHLVRMTDGSRHDQSKSVLERALASIPAADVQARARHAAASSVPETMDAAKLTAWTFDTPIMVVAELLGFPADEHRSIVDWTREFVLCLSPLSTPEQLASANRAAVLLRDRMELLLQQTEAGQDSLIAGVLCNARSIGWAETASIVANLIGIFSQTYEATAGLIGNSIVALASHPHLLDQVRATTDGWRQLVYETSRYDSSVQNTRRFVVEPATIGGAALAPGAAILLILAAANRDPSANPNPEAFLLDRADRCVFSFSRGAHACPGQALAYGIAAAALAVLSEKTSAALLAQLTWTIKPSTNGRVPLFHDVRTASDT